MLMWGSSPSAQRFHLAGVPEPRTWVRVASLPDQKNKTNCVMLDLTLETYVRYDKQFPGNSFL